MRFSLVLATVGRISELERFLQSLDAQTHREFELIVIDQNKGDQLAQVLDFYANKFPLTHVISEPGLSRARNVGLKHISGDVVAFPDDDCWYPSDLLERVENFFMENQDIDGLTGRMMDERGGSGNARFDREAGLLNQSNTWQRAASFTLFLRTKVVKTIGGFDESLGVGAGTVWGGGEDIDYALRAISFDFDLYYKPDIYVFHLGPPEWDCSKMAHRAYGYGAGIGRVWRKHNYPVWIVAYYLLRPIGGALLSLATGNRGKADYHFNSLRGRLKGWLFS